MHAFLRIRRTTDLGLWRLKTYGYGYLALFLSLARTGLISPIPAPKSSKASPPPPYNNMRKVLRLLSETDESSPTDISFVYSGYAPLSVRLVQCVVHKSGVLSSSTESANSREGDPDGVDTVPSFAQPISGWKGFEDAVKSVPGATADKIQHGTTASNEVDTRTTSLGRKQPFYLSLLIFDVNMRSSPAAVPVTGRQTTTMVFFLGGCTFTEIAALRWLNTQMKGRVRYANIPSICTILMCLTGRKILVGTTGIINGSKLLDSLVDGPVRTFDPSS